VAFRAAEPVELPSMAVPAAVDPAYILTCIIRSGRGPQRRGQRLVPLGDMEAQAATGIVAWDPE